jgi:hypothetical protein
MTLLKQKAISFNKGITTVLLLAFLLMSSPVRAEPCDPSDAPCITRKALEFKYKADALEEENVALRNENSALQSEATRSISPGTYFLGGIVVGAILTFIALR